tara:strand:+ start:23785 stop:24516 length:732 start_codon:yes stop_codon:yes gene_type:complete
MQSLPKQQVPPPPPPPDFGDDDAIGPRGMEGGGTASEVIDEDARVAGCTNINAVNYQSGATHDDGSCNFNHQIPGCIDPAALNYSGDFSVVWNGGSNYSWEGANVDDGSCLFSTYTCTDPQALNYNSECPPIGNFMGDGEWITEYSEFRISIPTDGGSGYEAGSDLSGLPAAIQSQLDDNQPVVFTSTSGPTINVQYEITSFELVSEETSMTNYMAHVTEIRTSRQDEQRLAFMTTRQQGTTY